MDTKKINALLVALEHGSLTAAAEELGYTQSGMTHMMNSLEDEIGLKLLMRTKSGVHLSPAGEELLSDMIALSDSAAKLERHIEKIKQKGTSSLKLGVYSSMTRQWLPSILAELRRTNPEMNVSVTVFSKVEQAYAAVKNASIDCSIASYAQSMISGMDWVHLRDDPLVAILPANFGFSGSAYPIEDFKGQEFMMPSGGFELDVAPLIASVGSDSTPLIRYSNLDDASLVSMVAHGLGVTVLSELVMENIFENVTAVPISPYACRQLGIIFNKSRKTDRNVSLLIDCAKRTISEMYAEC